MGQNDQTVESREAWRRDLDFRFGHRRTTNEIALLSHELVRSILKSATEAVCEQLGPCRENSLFVTKMEEAMLWAEAGFSRKRLELDPTPE